MSEEPISEAQKLMWAVIGVFIVGFLVVWFNKQESPKQIEAQSMIRNYVTIQSMANQKCPKAILENTGEEVFFPSETLSDKETYVTLKYVGEKKFKTATCIVHATIGGISELTIDDKTLIKKKI